MDINIGQISQVAFLIDIMMIYDSAYQDDSYINDLVQELRVA